jgi:hypothetical protein
MDRHRGNAVSSRRDSEYAHTSPFIASPMLISVRIKLS